MADWLACENAAHQSMDFAMRAGDDGLRLHALRLLALAQVQQGAVEAGKAMARQGLVEARQLGLRANESALLNTLTLAADLQDDAKHGLDLVHQDLAILRETGDRRREAIALSNLSGLWLALGDLAQARRDMDEALRMLRANGD